MSLRCKFGFHIYARIQGRDLKGSWSGVKCARCGIKHTLYLPEVKEVVSVATPKCSTRTGHIMTFRDLSSPRIKGRP